jgi:hypothetical protein
MPAILAVYVIQTALFGGIIYLLMVYSKQRPTARRMLRFLGLVIGGVLMAYLVVVAVYYCTLVR